MVKIIDDEMETGIINPKSTTRPSLKTSRIGLCGYWLTVSLEKAWHSDSHEDLGLGFRLA